MEVSTCIGRLMQQGCPTGLQRVRYDGVQATKTCAKMPYLMPEAWATGQGIVKGAITIIAPRTDRQRYRQRTGRDPVRCPHGHRAMGVWRI